MRKFNQINVLTSVALLHDTLVAGLAWWFAYLLRFNFSIPVDHRLQMIQSLLLMYWLGVVNNWFPISGLHSLNYDSLDTWGKIKDSLSHLFLPVVIPSITGLAGITLFVKNGMLDVLHQDYITTARAKGLNERKVIYTHALRNALLPLITIIGLSIPGLIGGSVIAETIFAIPGMGKLFYDAVLMRDFPVVMGILTIGSALTLLGNLLADLMYAWADPRVRRGVVKG